LRSSDLPFLRAVIPVLLEGVASAQEVASGIEDTLKKLDYSLQHLSPEMFKLTQQLFDVLGMGITRGPLTGVWAVGKTPAANRSATSCTAGKTAT